MGAEPAEYWLYRGLEKAAARFTDRIITVGEDLRERYLEAGIGRRSAISSSARAWNSPSSPPRPPWSRSAAPRWRSLGMPADAPRASPGSKRARVAATFDCGDRAAARSHDPFRGSRHGEEHAELCAEVERRGLRPSSFSRLPPGHRRCTRGPGCGCADLALGGSSPGAGPGRGLRSASRHLRGGGCARSGEGGGERVGGADAGRARDGRTGGGVAHRFRTGRAMGAAGRGLVCETWAAGPWSARCQGLRRPDGGPGASRTRGELPRTVEADT
jgi:hypothetical protein